jgi:cell wall-associated NlpC family hydrolase
VIDLVTPGQLNGGESAIYHDAIANALRLPFGEDRARVVHEAFDWLRTKWMHRNRTKGKGVDCGNFPLGVWIGAGLIPVSTELLIYNADFYLHSKEEKFRDAVEVYCDRLGVVDTMPGDLVGFQFTPGCPSICHVAIVVMDDHIIHARGGAFSKDGAVELGSLRGSYLKMFSGVWRFRQWNDAH